ncbi:MAG: hypothetical protein ACK52I_04785 [Pseudomonadota bacterium]|jgi:hypothetical protein
MKKVIFILVLCGLCSTRGSAQQLIGIRGGWFSGVTYQHYIESDKALEGIFQVQPNWINITGLYEVHKDLSDVQGMKWYYGAGAHIGSFSYRRDHPVFGDRYTTGGLIIGADAIIGLEYFFEEIPFQISVDYKPMINLTGGGWLYNDAALALRYTF